MYIYDIWYLIHMICPYSVFFQTLRLTKSILPSFLGADGLPVVFIHDQSEENTLAAKVQGIYSNIVLL